MMDSSKLSQVIFLQKAVKILEAMKCEFKIISEFGEFGKLEVNKPAIRMRRKRGSIDQIFNPKLASMKVGDLVTLDFEYFKQYGFETIADVGKAMGKYTNRLWGPGSTMYSSNKTTIEVLRVS
jgi:hypothetical protein